MTVSRRFNLKTILLQIALLSKTKIKSTRVDAIFKRKEKDIVSFI